MYSDEVNRLKLLLFNKSSVISHIHVFGEDGSGRSEIVRQLLREADEDWVCVSGDFLYADGSLRLILESLAADLGVKTRGDRAEDFICHVYEEVQWPDENNKKLIIFLDNAQTIVNYPPAPLQCFLDSPKAIDDLTVRFITSAPSCFNQYHIYLSHLQVIEFHVKSPSMEATKSLILRANPLISPQFVHFAVNSLMMFCNSPDILLSIINEAWALYDTGEKEKFDAILARDCLNGASRSKLGNDVKEQKVVVSEQSFESMPLAMRYLLIAAYCASNNPSQSDARYFAKNHGRDKRSEKKELRAEENRQTKELGPKASELQRIVCIYQTLLMLNESSVCGFDVKNVISQCGAAQLSRVCKLTN